MDQLEPRVDVRAAHNKNPWQKPRPRDFAARFSICPLENGSSHCRPAIRKSRLLWENETTEDDLLAGFSQWTELKFSRKLGFTPALTVQQGNQFRPNGRDLSSRLGLQGCIDIGESSRPGSDLSRAGTWLIGSSGCHHKDQSLLGVGNFIKGCQSCRYLLPVFDGYS